MQVPFHLSTVEWASHIIASDSRKQSRYWISKWDPGVLFFAHLRPSLRFDNFLRPNELKYARSIHFIVCRQHATFHCHTDCIDYPGLGYESTLGLYGHGTWRLAGLLSGMRRILAIADQYRNSPYGSAIVRAVSVLVDLRCCLQHDTHPRRNDRTRQPRRRWWGCIVDTHRRRSEWNIRVSSVSSALGWELQNWKRTPSVSAASVSSVQGPCLCVCVFRNGEKYAAEIHFVHKNQQTGKLAVLGMLVQSSQNRDSNAQGAHELDMAAAAEWKRYFDAIQQLKQANSSSTLSLKLSTLLSKNSNNFWRYEGSLTTPPCTEIVTWTVFKTPIVMNETHIDSLRRGVFPMNYREPQPLSNRVVYRNFPDAMVPTVPNQNNSGKGATHHRFQLIGLVLLLGVFLPFLQRETVIWNKQTVVWCRNSYVRNKN